MIFKGMDGGISVEITKDLVLWVNTYETVDVDTLTGIIRNRIMEMIKDRSEMFLPDEINSIAREAASIIMME